MLSELKIYNYHLFKQGLSESLCNQLIISSSFSKKRTVSLSILSLLITFGISGNIFIILLTYKPWLNNDTLYLVLLVQSITALLFLSKKYKPFTTELLFITSESILIYSVIFYKLPDSTGIYQTSVFIMPVILLSSSLFSHIFCFLINSGILILFNIIYYYINSGFIASYNSGLFRELCINSTIMIVYGTVILIIFRILVSSIITEHNKISNNNEITALPNKFCRTLSMKLPQSVNKH